MIATERLFRSTLLASIVLGIAGGMVDFVFPHLIPQELQDAHDAVMAADWEEQHMASAIGIVVSGVILIVGGIAAVVGLWFFRSWAPVLALCMTVLSCAVAAYPSFGAFLVSGLGWALQEAAATLWGVMLALAYFSPLKQRFSGTPNGQP